MEQKEYPVFDVELLESLVMPCKKIICHRNLINEMVKNFSKEVDPCTSKSDILRGRMGTIFDGKVEICTLYNEDEMPYNEFYGVDEKGAILFRGKISG